MSEKNQNAAKTIKATKNANKGQKAPKAQKPASKRPSSASKATDRSFKLSAEKLAAIREGAKNGFANPYRPSSSYHACVQALYELGVGKFHQPDAIVPAVVKAMADAAKSFKAKEGRNENAKDWKERIIQNVKVLTRPDYGQKLRQLNHEVRWDREKGAGLFRTK